MLPHLSQPVRAAPFGTANGSQIPQKTIFKFLYFHCEWIRQKNILAIYGNRKVCQKEEYEQSAGVSEDACFRFF
jgi:hypothetical protein